MSIAEHHGGQDLATIVRTGKNIRPYLLSLGHFFEEYRTGLASYINNPFYAPSYRTFDARVQGEMLETKYNEQTVQRICLTYKFLNRMGEQTARWTRARELGLDHGT